MSPLLLLLACAAPAPAVVDPDAGYAEVELAAPEGFRSRQAEYLAYCRDASGPGQGAGLYGQVCRVAAGEPVDVDVVAAGADTLDARQDTADFAAAAMVRLLYLDDDAAVLDADTRARVEEAVLGFKYWIDEPGDDTMCFWTENHQVLFHSAELLAGQRFADRTFGNDGRTGAEHAEHAARLLERWLDLRGRHGFSEWHSNVYFNEDIPALVNVADFADDPVLRAKAAAVLDLLAFDLANNTFRGLFATVHGRTYENKLVDGLRDSTQEAAWVMLGLGTYQDTADFSASFLATSTGYFTPGLLEDVAAAATERHEHRQRDGFDVADAAELGLGTSDQDDVIVWAGMSALATPEVIEGTVAMVDDLDLWDGFLFADLPDEVLALLQAADDAGTLPELATTLAPITRGIALEGMDTVVYRTPHYQLAGGQDYNPALWASQTLMWTATLDAEAYVFTSYPSELATSSVDAEIAGQWIGSWLPRVTLHHNVGVIQYRTQDVPLADAYLSADHTHAFFPRDRFDTWTQVGHWTFGRKGDAWVGLWSQGATTWVEGEEETVELDAEGAENVWVVEVGSVEEWESWESFVATVGAIEPEVGDRVRYPSPTVGVVEVGWEGPMTVDGEAVALGPNRRWDNAYAQVERGAPVTRIDLDDLRLVLDFEGGERRLLQAE